MPKKPTWVSDGSERKFVRALEVLRKEGNMNPTESDVKKLYMKFGGLVVGDVSTERGTDNDTTQQSPTAQMEIKQDEESDEEETPLEKMKVGDLRRMAEARGIDASEMKKDEIVEALKA